MGSCLERPPSIEANLACDKFLCVAELEAGFQYLPVVEVLKSWQGSPDLSRDRIVSFVMPTQVLLGLLLEVFEVRHRRSYGLHVVGGHCPFGVVPMRPTAAVELCPIALGIVNRTDVSCWHKCEVPECPFSRRCWGDSGRDADIV